MSVLDLNVTSTASVDAAAASVLEDAGPPDVVINNAGQMFVGVAEAFTPEEVSAQLDVNVVGVHRVNRAFLPAMRTRGSGVIVNISSIAGRLSVPFHAIYHASKWALEGYSIGLRAELASSGVDVVLVEPGPFTTALFPGIRRPVDADDRIDSYPTIVHDTQAAISAMFEGMFNDANTPTDPELVVDRLVELVDMTPGARPLRSVVGVDFGVRDRNATVEPHDTGLYQAAGLTEFVTLKTNG